MLLAVEVLDAVARVLVLAEVGLVLVGIELGRFVPLGVLLSFQLVDCSE